jgi:putative DNA primase/helicase
MSQSNPRRAEQRDDDIDALPADAVKFLKRLDPTATRFEFRTFDDNKDRGDQNLTRTFSGTLTQHFVKLKRLNDKGAGVFVTINETDGKGRAA